MNVLVDRGLKSSGANHPRAGMDPDDYRAPLYVGHPVISAHWRSIELSGSGMGRSRQADYAWHSPKPAEPPLMSMRRCRRRRAAQAASTVARRSPPQGQDRSGPSRLGSAGSPSMRAAEDQRPRDTHTIVCSLLLTARPDLLVWRPGDAQQVAHQVVARRLRVPARAAH